MKTFKIKKNESLTKTITNSINFKNLEDGQLYCEEAFDIISKELTKAEIDEFGCESWFCIMQNDEGEYFAVAGDGEITSDSLCYYAEVEEIELKYKEANGCGTWEYVGEFIKFIPSKKNYNFIIGKEYFFHEMDRKNILYPGTDSVNYHFAIYECEVEGEGLYASINTNINEFFIQGAFLPEIEDIWMDEEPIIYIYHNDHDSELEGISGTYAEIKAAVESIRDCNFEEISNIEDISWMEEI